MKLAVFDIDGTLTVGDGLGTRCFFSTLAEMFGEAGIDRRLESYAESTDCGIAREAARRALGRDAEPHEFDAFKSAYLELLDREIAARTRPYRPVAGAEEILPRVASMPGWHVAIATGNWRRAAALKLDCATIRATAPRACSEDGVSRAGVLAAAISAASADAGGIEYEKVVYVGDQPWDVRAARAMSAAFVGIGHGVRADRLAETGALVAADYRDVARFVEMLEAASSPRTDF